MKQHRRTVLAGFLAGLLLLSAAACTPEQKEDPKETDLVTELGLTKEAKAATETTVEVNSALYSQFDFENTQEAEFATRGLIDAPEELELTDADGNVIWSMKAYSFLNDYEKAPDTVNPSLWENTKNNYAYGLFEVMDGIYQVRGYDITNLTLIAGDTGWIVFDPLMSVECTQAAMQLVEKNLGSRPVRAVIVSHTHTDHFGGIKGLMTEEELADRNLPIDQQLASGKIPLIVPEDFTEYVISENVYAGKAMARRANYQYGVLLQPGETGKVGSGIGMAQSTGTISFLLPTHEVTGTGETLTIDGVELEFQMTPGSEAPAEMNTWLPQKKALWAAENCVSTMHNLYTLRGAKVRDGAAWSQYITESIQRYGDAVEVVFQSHNWPHWGNEMVNDYLLNTAAIYKFINDQTLTYINQGYTADEISNKIELPAELEKGWYSRQYYGTVEHNSQAVYQAFMGWYDANPVHLNPLTPTDSAKKWVEYLGDTNEVLRKAKEDFAAGEYQWVAEVTNVIVFADPENTAARLLCADALEQLGYQAESGIWRNFYLTAALELREGNAEASVKQSTFTSDMLKEMTPDLLFDYFGILLDKQALADYDFVVNINLTDLNEQYILRFRYGVLLVTADTSAEEADLTLTGPKAALFALLQQDADSLAEAMTVEGDTALLELIADNLNEFVTTGAADFNIVEP